MDKSLLDTTPATNLLTLKEYIYVYPRLMTEYQKLGEDCSEMYFIEEQIEEHFIHIDSYKNARKRILDAGYKEKYGTFEDYHLMVRSFDIRVTSLKAIIEYLETKKAELGKPRQNKMGNTDEVNSHPSFDTNLWNELCFELFKYLFDNYYTSTPRELTNIWHFLKRKTDNKYVLKATKNKYKVFIFKNYHIKITNFDKAEDKWNEKEFPTLQDHRINFEENLK